MGTKLIAGAIVVLLGAGIAVVALGLVGGRSDAAALVPRDALAYVDLSLNPSLSQKRALGSLAERLPDDAQDKLAKEVPKFLDSLVEEMDLDYEKDVKPWLGDEVAGFVHTADPDPVGAALLATTDPEAALATATAAVEKDMGPLKDATHREVSYSTSSQGALALVGDYLAVGHPAAVKAVIDASHDGGLSATESYSSLVGNLEPDRVITYWVDGRAVLDAAQKADLLTDEQLEQMKFPGFGQLETSFAGSVFATSEAVVLEQAATKSEDATAPYALDDPELLGRSPANAWFGLAMPDVGENAKTLIDTMAKDEPVGEQFSQALGLQLDDVLAWMGDGALYVGGGQLSNLSGALSITSSDPSATEEFVTALVDFGKTQGAAGTVRSTTVGDLKGFEFADPASPARFTILGGDRLILAVDSQGAGENSTATAGVTGDGETLADDSTYTDAGAALGTGYAPVLYLDVTRATKVVKSAFGESSTPPGFTEAEKYIARVAYVMAGSRDDNERVVQRLVIGTADP